MTIDRVQHNQNNKNNRESTTHFSVDNLIHQECNIINWGSELVAENDVRCVRGEKKRRGRSWNDESGDNMVTFPYCMKGM